MGYVGGSCFWFRPNPSQICDTWPMRQSVFVGWILERWDRVMWTGLIWLRIGTGGELL
jgi:hypothetical protein